MPQPVAFWKGSCSNSWWVLEQPSRCFVSVPFAKKLLADVFISRQIVGLPGERVNVCQRLRLPGSLSSSKCWCPWPFPPELLHSLLSGSGSPTPCQAISALLTGNKTNLTIESKFGCCVFFFSPEICAEMAQQRADGVS